MSTIEELNNEIRKLQIENDPYKEQLTNLLLKQSTEQLDAEQKRELVDQIKIFDKRISENNQIILQNKKQIEEKEKQITVQIEEKEKRITAQIKEKEKRDTLDKQLQINLEISRNQGKSAASIDSL